MQKQTQQITITDGIPLKVSLRRAERKNKIRSFLFVVPTLLLILFAFLIPIFDMLILSIHTPEVVTLLPKTVKALKSWDETTGLPDETAFAAHAEELIKLRKERILGQVTLRLNYEKTGMRSLFNKTARKIRKLKAGPFKEKMIAMDNDWENREIWVVIKRMGKRFTSTHYLAAFDLKYNVDNNIVSQPQVQQIHKQWIHSIKNSIIIGFFATIFATFFGTLAAWGLSRPHTPFRVPLMGLLISPMIVPLIITAAGMFFFYSKVGLAQTYPGLILAHTALGIPFVIITVTATLMGFDQDLIRATACLGAHPVTTFRKVVMPLILPGVISGALFALMTSFMEAEMAAGMTWVEDIREWTDGIAGEWQAVLEELYESSSYQTIGVEKYKLHPVVFDWVKHKISDSNRKDISAILAGMRMVKSPEDIDTMRQAGQVAVAMCDAAVETIAVGVPEYEISLAALNAGTRRAAEIIGTKNDPSHFSPMIHNLQVLQSGPNLSMVHGRPTLRRIKKGDPIYMCFCPFTLFKQIKLGFDREFFVGRVSDEHAKVYEIALKAQAAALAMIRPGVPAEDVHFASLEVYQKAGFGTCYRTGRGVGYSFLEKPEFKDGDKTPLQAGMTFAVDGGITIPGKFGARVGDSIVVTEDGFEYLTPYPKDLRIL